MMILGVKFKNVKNIMCLNSQIFGLVGFFTKSRRPEGPKGGPKGHSLVGPSVWFLWSKFEGSPIPPKAQPPLVHKLKKIKEADLVPYQLYFKAGLHTKQMKIMYTDINIIKQLTGKSVHCWVI